MKRREEHQPRLLAWLLCLAMLIGMLPGTAWAAEKTETVELTSGDSLEVSYEDKDNSTAQGYATTSFSDGEGWKLSINTQGNVVDKSYTFLYIFGWDTLKNVTKVEVEVAYAGIDGSTAPKWTIFSSNADYGWADEGNVWGDTNPTKYIGVFKTPTTLRNVGFKVESDAAINGTLTIKSITVTMEDSGGENPPSTEHFINVTALVNTETPSNPGDSFPPLKVKIDGTIQEIEIPMEVWSAKVVQVTSAAAGGTDITDKTSIHYKKASTVLAVNTEGIQDDIDIVVTYFYGDRPAPEDQCTIAFKGINQDTGENMWFSPAEPAEITGGKQEFQLKVDSSFHPDSIAGVTKTSDGSDIASRVKPTLDGTTLTLDTTDIDFNITVSINYIWKDDGGGDEPAIPATGPDWTFDSDTQGWHTGNSWGVTGDVQTAWADGRLGVTANWSDDNSQAVLAWEPDSPVSVAGKNYLIMDVFYDASKLTSGALSIEPFAGAGEENLFQTVEPVSHWDGEKEETVTEITGLQGVALTSGEAASGGLTKQTLYFCFNATAASIPQMSLRINGTAANAYNGTLCLDNIRFGTAPGYITTTCSLDWKPEVFTPSGFVPILEREQTFRAKITESGFELDKITISAQHGTPPKITDEMSSSGVVTINTKGLSGKVLLSAQYVWPAEFNPGGSSEPGYSPSVSGGGSGGNGSGSTSVGQGLSAKVQPSVRNGGAYSEVSAAAVTKLLSQAEKSKEPVKVLTIAPKVSSNSPLKVSEVTIQSAELNALGTKTGANLRIGSHIADITIASKTVSQLAEQEQAVSFTTERNGNMVKVTVSRDGKPLSNVPGGIRVELHKPCNFYTAAYLVPDPDHPENRQPIPLSMASQDGKTMQILLPGSGTVVLENKPSDFLDMRGGTWGIGPVDFAYSHGIFNGDTSGRFRPNDTMTRAMMVQILYNFEGRPEGKPHQFADTRTGDWYAAAAGWAVDKGIVYGYADGSFVPGSTITRQQAVCFLYRWAGSPEADTAYLEQFTDGPSVGKFAQEAMAWAAKNGILSGSSTTVLSPTEPVTRYQAAQMVTNLVARQIAAPWSGKEW